MCVSVSDMTWTKSTTTKHTCGGPVFGRKTPGCPRCDELLAGAAPVQWAGASSKRCTKCGGPDDAGCMVPVCYACQIKAHDCRANNCGPVCTAFDW